MGLRDVDVVDYTSEFHVVFSIVVTSMNDLECLAQTYKRALPRHTLGTIKNDKMKRRTCMLLQKS